MKTFGLIGYPLGHSFSRRFFSEKFARENIEAQYLNFELADLRTFPQLIADNPNIGGLNVTIPYKQQIIPFLDEMDETADHIGAVNVVRFIRNEKGLKLKGYNSDVIGFTESIRPLLRAHHTKALVLGTGGASKAVCAGLKSLGIEPQYVSRQTSDNRILTYAQLTEEVIREHTVIVNTTPLGMHPKTEDCPDIPYHLLTKQHLLYDLVYNPETTLFMEKGMAQGAVVKNGLEMLEKQALAAWEIWNRE